MKTYGQILFKDTNPNDLKEFDRTILSVLLHHYIKDKGDNRLTRDTFDRIREFIINSFDTEEKENLLLYYMVINDLGKSQKVIDILKEKGITSIEHDLLLSYLLQYDMLQSLSGFSNESKQKLMNVLNYGINVGQYIQRECVDYSFNSVLRLSQGEKDLMIAEAMLDIAGVLGHVNNQNGSAILNESTADNILTASNILSTCKDSSKLFDNF